MIDYTKLETPSKVVLGRREKLKPILDLTVELYFKPLHRGCHLKLHSVILQLGAQMVERASDETASMNKLIYFVSTVSTHQFWSVDKLKPEIISHDTFSSLIQ